MPFFLDFYSDYLWLFSILVTVTLAIAYILLCRFAKKRAAISALKRDDAMKTHSRKNDDA